MNKITNNIKRIRYHENKPADTRRSVVNNARHGRWRNNRTKPNVIFILTDDQGWGDLGAAGHPYMRTTNLDRLAEEGTRFSGYYSLTLNLVRKWLNRRSQK